MARLCRAAIIACVALAACGGGGSASTTAVTPSDSPSTPQPAGPGADPAGDAFTIDGSSPGYLDMTRAAVSRTGGHFTFTEALVAPVPPTPTLPAGDEALGWSVCVDLTGTAAVGFPMATVPMPCEFIVHTRWDGTKLAGLLIDRRPLARGHAALTTSFEPVVAGTELRMVIPARSLGEPKSFAFSMFTEELGPLGTDIARHVDEAPDGGPRETFEWPPS